MRTLFMSAWGSSWARVMIWKSLLTVSFSSSCWEVSGPVVRIFCSWLSQRWYQASWCYRNMSTWSILTLAAAERWVQWMLVYLKKPCLTDGGTLFGVLCGSIIFSNMFLKYRLRLSWVIELVCRQGGDKGRIKVVVCACMDSFSQDCSRGAIGVLVIDAIVG